MLNKDKGIILIEIPAIICILMILSLISIRCFTAGEEVRNFRKVIREDRVIFKALVKEFIYNSDFNKVNSIFDSNPVMYINSDKLDIIKIMEGDALDAMEANTKNDDRYIKIEKVTSDTVINLSVEFINKRYEPAGLKEEIYISKNIKL